jgi:hypothetical protein
MATEAERDCGQLDLSSIIDIMIAGEDDEREAGAFAVAEFVAESDSRQVLAFYFNYLAICEFTSKLPRL